jgi:hypothetical protein
MSLSSHCTQRMQSPDVAFFILLNIYMGFAIEETSERLNLQWVGIFEYRNSTNRRGKGLRVTNYFLLIFTCLRMPTLLPWVVTKQPEINLDIKSFESVSVWWTRPTKGSKYQQKNLPHKTIHVEFATPSRQSKTRSDVQSVQQIGRKCIHFPVEQLSVHPIKDNHVTLQQGTFCTWIFFSN